AEPGHERPAAVEDEWPVLGADVRSGEALGEVVRESTIGQHVIDPPGHPLVGEQGFELPDLLEGRDRAHEPERQSASLDQVRGRRCWIDSVGEPLLTEREVYLINSFAELGVLVFASVVMADLGGLARGEKIRAEGDDAPTDHAQKQKVARPDHVTAPGGMFFYVTTVEHGRFHVAPSCIHRACPKLAACSRVPLLMT